MISKIPEALANVIQAHVASLAYFAYVDPNAGGWLYQMMLPVAVGIAGAWTAFRQWIRRKRGKSQDEEDSDNKPQK